MTKEIEKISTRKKTNSDNDINRSLILINDEVHSFDYVIEVLMSVCSHSIEQATQCTMITHYKGKCDIKRGSLKELRSLRATLIDYELKAEIN